MQDDKEVRQRGLEGYITITREYVNNGSSKSIQGMIVESLITQSRSLQEKLWEEQQDKFDIRKNRWSEVAGYIMNRGKKEWQENYGEFKSRWSKWRFDAKKMISDGEEWWIGVNSGIMQEMNTWTEETSRASSKEAAERIYSGLDERISKYEKDLKNRMPGNSGFSIDTDKILKESMRNNPVDSIGILTQSMLSTDTTAGFTDILNLGLDGSLLRHNEEQMKEYSIAMGVMKNLKVVDILNEIIAGFNKQLIEANESVYKGVDTNIWRNETFGIAPFKRKEKDKKWEIEVCVESNLTGDKFKTRDFKDYKDYTNSTVFLKPIKGLGGITVDFTQTSTYSNLDGEDLDTYVGLETEWLSREIEGVFSLSGTFSTHQQDEYERLGEKFGKYYGDWMAGEALQDAGFYAKPIVPHGPNLLQTASIAASMSGQVWIAVAVSAATSAIQMADGTMTWKQAAFQVGMSAATASLGAGAGKLGDMASVAAGGSKILGAAVTSSVSAVGTTLLSNVTLEGGHVGVDEDRLTSWRTWAGTGITAAAGTIANGYMQSDMSRGLVNGTGSGLTGGITTGDWKDSMTDGLRGAAAGYLSGKMGGAFTTSTGLGGGAITNLANFGFKNLMGDDDKFSWDMVAQNNAIGDAIGGYLNEALMSDALKLKMAEDATKNTESQKNAMDKAKSMDNLDLGIFGIFKSIRDDFSGTIQDFGRAADDIGAGLSYAANVAGNFAESVKNGVKYGEFGTDNDPAVQRAVIQDKFGSMLTEVKESGKWNSIPNEDKVAMFQKLEAEGISLTPEQQADYDTAWNNFQNEIIQDAVANGDYSLLEVMAAYPGAKEMQKFNTAEQNAKDSESWSPTGRVVNSEDYKGDPKTTVNVNGTEVPSRGARVDIMDYGDDAENHPEQWSEMDDFSDKKHYKKTDDPTKVDLDSNYNSKDGMPWYGPNAEFTVDDFNIGESPHQGTTLRLNILDENRNIIGKVEMGHLTEVNKEIYNADKNQIFKPGTILGKTNRLIGCSTGFHLHMKNLQGNRRALYKLLSGQ